MKLLIVDDFVPKVGKLVEVLIDAGVQRSAIDVVTTAMQARAKLREVAYDLVVLDLMLPVREDSEPTTKAAVDLLRDLTERDHYLKPKRIVGFTAYSEVAAELAGVFSELLWVVVSYDETSEAWKGAFRNTAKYLLRQESQDSPSHYDLDLCIVAALQVPELAAVHRLPWQWEEPSPIDDSTFVRRGRFQSGGEEYSVIAAAAPRMGSVAAALLATKLIEHFRPRFLVMPGICAGVRGKAEIGDAILFDPTWEWPSGKLVHGDTGTYLEPAPHQIAIPEFLSSRYDQLGRDTRLLGEIRNAWPTPPKNVLRFLTGPGASGSAVVADVATVDSVRAQHRKLTALDMEVYGVYAAARSSCVPRPSVLAIKSVCDFADEKKVDDWQAYAAYTSAEAMRHFFEKNMGDIAKLAGS